MKAGAAILAILLPACALTTKAPPIDLRYFSPEGVTATVSRRQAAQGAIRLRLGRVASSANLRDRIVHRDSEFEVREYETLRWTEDPEVYVQRAMANALFDGRELEQAVSGPLPTLDVDVIAFEEVRSGVTRGGRVALRYELRDDYRVLGAGVVVAERPATSNGVEQIISAIAGALTAATSQLADEVAGRLRR